MRQATLGWALIMGSACLTPPTDTGEDAALESRVRDLEEALATVQSALDERATEDDVDELTDRVEAIESAEPSATAAELEARLAQVRFETERAAWASLIYGTYDRSDSGCSFDADNLPTFYFRGGSLTQSRPGSFNNCNNGWNRISATSPGGEDWIAHLFIDCSGTARIEWRTDAQGQPADGTLQGRGICLRGSDETPPSSALSRTSFPF